MRKSRLLQLYCNIISPNSTADAIATGIASTLTAQAPLPTSTLRPENIAETMIAETMTSAPPLPPIMLTITPNILQPSPTNVMATATPGQIQPTAIAIIETPRVQDLPPTAISPVLIDTIEILGNSNTGEQFLVPKTGKYSFKFNSGGYCTYATDPGFATCLPTIWIFEGDAEMWQDDGRSLNQDTASRVIAPLSDCQAGRNAYCRTIEDSDIQGRNSSAVRMNLTEGSMLTLIGVDNREAYADNPGEVLIDVYYLPE
jgi:hypothetical protein